MGLALNQDKKKAKKHNKIIVSLAVNIIYKDS